MTASAHATSTRGTALSWADQAACRGEDLDVFFSGSAESLRIARWYCGRCPVRQQCLDLAMQTEDTSRHGIFGGLTVAERAALAKGKTPKPPKPERTPEAILQDYTKELVPGHLCWVGPDAVSYQNRTHTSRQIAFLAARGRRAEGRVTTICDVGTCMVHIEDELERTRCGTRGGYQRHLREGSEPCRPCRDANAAADRALRTTGSTKAAS